MIDRMPELRLVPGLAFETWEVLIGAHAISTAPVPRADGAEDAQVCTSCHRIGGHETCSNRVGFATGDEPVPQSSDWAWSSILSRTTMPPAPESWHAMEDGEVSALWEELYRDHVDMLACCCADPTALGCTRQDLMASPLEVPVAGAGPASCYPVPR